MTPTFGLEHFGTQFGPASDMERWMLNSVETRLLLLAGRPEAPKDLDGLVEAAIDAGIDWRRFVGLARSHRLTPNVGRNLYRSQSVPDDVRPAFERMVAFTTQRGLVSAGALRRIIASLGDSGIPSLPMKGPALSAWLYADWTRRVFADLDVLVDKEDIGRAMAVMESIGFGPFGTMHQLTPEEAAVADREFYLHDAACWHPELRVKLELHWSALSDPTYRTVGREMQRLVHVDPVERDHGIMAAHVLIHGAHHGYRRLLWLLDAAVLGSVLDDRGWHRAIDMTVADYVVNTVLLGPYLGHRLFGLPVSPIAAPLIEERLSSLRTMAELTQMKTPDSAGGIEQPGALRLQGLLRDRRRDRVVYLVNKLTRPSLPDMNANTLRPGWRGRMSRLRVQVPRWTRFIRTRVIPRWATKGD
ncbi:MAG: nucleotidyltransferase family protein [Actinomycetia bacterium]|nr:nucleotidyltransferase family protein [Actinomycetes bacterium]